jgi:hypothetical protein
LVGRLCEAGRECAGVAVFKERLLLRLQPVAVSRARRVAAYFNGLPKWRSRSVEFTDVRVAEAAANVINMAATVSFVLDEGATTLSVKITWVIVREDGDWKIVSHHVSSRTPLI